MGRRCMYLHEQAPHEPALPAGAQAPCCGQAISKGSSAGPRVLPGGPSVPERTKPGHRGLCGSRSNAGVKPTGPGGWCPRVLRGPSVLRAREVANHSPVPSCLLGAATKSAAGRGGPATVLACSLLVVSTGKRARRVEPA